MQCCHVFLQYSSFSCARHRKASYLHHFLARVHYHLDGAEGVEEDDGGGNGITVMVMLMTLMMVMMMVMMMVVTSLVTSLFAQDANKRLGNLRNGAQDVKKHR